MAPTGARATVHYQRGLPPVVNEPSLVRRIESAMSELGGPECTTATHLSMGAEDFARYLEEVPGALLRLGCRAGDGMDLHSAAFLLDEACLEVGVRLGAGMLLRRLAD